MNYTINSLDPTIAYIYANSVLDTIFQDLPNVKTFLFNNGDYYINDNLVIQSNGITFRSISKNPRDVHIYQNNTSKDSVVLRNCNHVKIEGISIHNGWSGKVALTVAGVNYSTIKSCYIYGNSDTFTVYYAGPTDLTEGQSTITGYENNNLDNINVFEKNVVYSNWSGDNVAFCLQKNGRVSDNIIRGGKLAVYMCRDTNIKANTIYDSTSNGIYISFPSHNIVLDCNKIYECQASAIKLANQAEHGAFTSSPYNIIIHDNKLYDSKFYGVELNNAIEVSLVKNHLLSTDIYGIYVANSDNVKLSQNTITYFKVGIWLENSTELDVYSNTFNSVYPDESDNLVKAVGSSKITITNNCCRGVIKYDLYSIDTTNTDFYVGSTDAQLFYSYNDELKMMKL